MLASLIRAQQGRRSNRARVTATPHRWGLSGRNSAAGQGTRPTHSLSLPQIGWCEAQLGITRCAPRNEPLACCLLFGQGFQGSRLPSLGEQHELRRCCTTGLATPAAITQRASVKRRHSHSLQWKGTTPASYLRSRQHCENQLAHQVDNPSCFPTALLRGH